MKPTLFLLLGLMAATPAFAQHSGEYIRLVQDFVGPRAGAGVVSQAVAGEDAFYWMEPDLQGGSALWGSDGSYSGTQNINRKLVDLGISQAQSLFIFDGELYVFTSDFRSGDQLLTLGLGEAPATPIARLDASGKGEPSLVAVGDEVFYFTVNQRRQPLNTLWVSDGTQLGTFEISVPGGAEDFRLSPDDFLRGDTLYFSTDDFEQEAPVYRYFPGVGTAEVLRRGGGEASEPFNAANVLDGGDRVFLVTDNVSLLPYGEDGPREALTGPPIERIASSQTATVSGAFHFFAEDAAGTLGVYRVEKGADSYQKIFDNLSINSIRGSDIFLTANDRVYFYGLSPASAGPELFVISPGGVVAQLTDLYTDRDNRFAYAVGTLDGKLIFAAQRDGITRDLWATDGTTEGTIRIAALGAEEGENSLGDWAFSGGYLYFSFYEAREGGEIYRTDGTTGGTERVTDIAAEAGGESSVRRLLAFGDELVFRAFDPKLGRDWYLTDGTTTGTELIYDLPDSDFGSNVQYIGIDSASGRLLLTAFGGDLDPALFSTDGSERGTRRMRALNPAFSRRLYPQIDGNFVLSVFDEPGSNSQGVYLLSGDGSDLRPLRAIEADDASRFSEFTRAGNLVYFADNTETVWVTDGTETGTRAIFQADERRQEVMGAIDLVALGDNITFTAYKDSVYRRWIVEGTTGEVSPLSPDECCRRPSLPVTIGNEHLFFFKSGESVILYGFSAERSEPARTIATFNQLGSNVTEVVGNNLYFSAASSRSGGARLHRFDAESGELSIVDQTADGEDLRGGFPLAGSDSILYFSSLRGRFAIYRTDGTTEGTWGVSEVPGEDGIVHNDRFYFVVNSDTLGRELYASNGAPDDAYLVDELRPGRETTYPLNFLSTEAGLFFTAISPTLGRELFTLSACTDRPNIVATPSEQCGDYVTINLPASRGEREVRILEGPDFTEVTYFENSIRLRGEAGQKYTVQFFASDQGCGDLGRTITFRIPDAEAGCDELVGTEPEVGGIVFGLSAYPNPTSGALTVEVATEQPEAASIWVVDSRGRRVLRREVVTGGQTTLRLGDLPTGVYYLVVEAQRGRVVRTVIRR